MADFGDFNIQLDNPPLGDSERAEKEKKISFQNSGPSSFSSDSHANNSYNNKNEDQMNLGTSDYNLSNAAHPMACIATVAFKGLALFFYLFVGMFSPDVITFIVVMILSSLDFWTVKNVTGRLLVGLRWWSDYDEKGEQIWKFQSFDKEFKSNSVDKTFFWSGQLASTVVWAVFLFIKVISLSPFWAMLDAINFSLSATNLYGFYKCRGDHTKKIKDLKSQSLRHFAGKILG